MHMRVCGRPCMHGRAQVHAIMYVYVYVYVCVCVRLCVCVSALNVFNMVMRLK